jgi:hypothetical protein
MKKTKSFDAVRVMRAIRDRMSREMRGMTPAEQIEYIRKAAGPREKVDRSEDAATANA